MSISRLSMLHWTSRFINGSTQPFSLAASAGARHMRTLCSPGAHTQLLTPSSRLAASSQLPLQLLLQRSPLSGSAAAPAGGNIVAIQDDADYDARVRNNSKQPVLLQFHATWCAPCKMLRPRLEKAVRGRPKLLLATVDVDDMPDLAAEFRVASVPTVLAMQGGRVVASFSGLKEPEAVQDFVDSFAEKQGL